MTPRRPKDIGTAAESAVVKYLQANGFNQAERRALRGQFDVGDITGTPGLIWEIKGGDAARNASDAQIESWLFETETERLNAAADIGVLVVVRPRKNVRDWWAAMWGGDFASLYAGLYQRYALDIPIRTQLHHVVDLLRLNGYGQPHDPPDLDGDRVVTNTA